LTTNLFQKNQPTFDENSELTDIIKFIVAVSDSKRTLVFNLSFLGVSFSILCLAALLWFIGWIPNYLNQSLREVFEQFLDKNALLVIALPLLIIFITQLGILRRCETKELTDVANNENIAKVLNIYHTANLKERSHIWRGVLEFQKGKTTIAFYTGIIAILVILIPMIDYVSLGPTENVRHLVQQITILLIWFPLFIVASLLHAEIIERERFKLLVTIADQAISDRD